MTDPTGHGALLLLAIALVARPLSRFWAGPLRYRRAIGVGAFLLAAVHGLRSLEHAFDWNLRAIAFLIPIHRWGFYAGVLAIALLLPLALTSFDSWQQRLGKRWRQLHLLSMPALFFAVLHAVLLGSSYLGELQRDWSHYARAWGVAIAAIVVLGDAIALGVVVVCGWRSLCCCCRKARIFRVRFHQALTHRLMRVSISFCLESMVC